MTFEEIFEYYDSLPRKGRRKKIMEHFNSLEISERRGYIQYLENLPDGGEKVDNFTTILREQAVKEYWNNERKLILSGENTREWTIEQIEAILNFDENGNMKSNAGKAFQLDESGNQVVKDAKGNTSYYGHHMLDVENYPEYAGEWRNIQALTHDEHYKGAHPNGNTSLRTDYYYDPNTGEQIKIDTSKDVNFVKLDYPPKTKCVIKADDVMRKSYMCFDELSDIEQFALKNIDLAMCNGDVKRFNSTLELTKKYGVQNFCERIGLKTVDEIKQMYGILEGCDDVDTINKYRLYEYATQYGHDKNAGAYDGLVDDTKLSELFGKDRYNNFSTSEKQQAADLSNKLDKFLNSNDSQDGTAKDTSVKGNTAGDTDMKQGSSGSSDSTSDSGTKHTGSSDSDGTKSNTGESSDKSAGAHESSGGDDAGTKHTGTGDDGNVKHTGTGEDGNGILIVNLSTD